MKNSAGQGEIPSEIHSEICRILHILRKPNSRIALLLNSLLLNSSRGHFAFCWMTQPCAQVFSFNGSIIFDVNYWFNNLQRAPLLTSFWRQWFNNLQRTALLKSLVQYDRILGQQQLFMVNYACGFNQLETGKYFEWIIINRLFWALRPWILIGSTRVFNSGTGTVTLFQKVVTQVVTTSQFKRPRLSEMLWYDISQTKIVANKSTHLIFASEEFLRLTRRELQILTTLPHFLCTENKNKNRINRPKWDLNSWPWD